MTTGKTIALTRWTFVGKVMSLLFNLSRLIIMLQIYWLVSVTGASQVAQWVKNLPANTGDTGDMGWIPGSGSSRGVGNGNSSVLAWNIPWTEEPGGLQSTESQRVRQDWSNYAWARTGITEWSLGQNPVTQSIHTLQCNMWIFRGSLVSKARGFRF